MTHDLTHTPAWQALSDHCENMQRTSMQTLFANNPQRFAEFSLEAGPIFLDYSKNRITQQTLDHLINFAEQQKLHEHIESLLQGQAINFTQGRAALHPLLRQDDVALHHSSRPHFDAIQYELNKMQRIVERIHNKQWLGYSNQPITDVVTIGIGGSHLGPAMVVRALHAYTKSTPRCHFIANIDGHELHRVLAPLNPATTLLVCASKTFTTQETMTNFATARCWLQEAGVNPLDAHCLAITNRVDIAKSQGFIDEHILQLPEGVGGRYSLWSTMGLAIALAIGMEHFNALRKGAQDMDMHFRSAPFSANMPVILGLLGIWYHNFFHAENYAIVPYAQELELIVPYLQQLDMESNGKSINRRNQKLTTTTGPILWGGIGTNSQHAFSQLLHQGTRLVPVDFILALQPHHDLIQHHQRLVAHCFAQSAALLMGNNSADKHKQLDGNRPSNTLIIKQLNPTSLGALIALYEHKVFVQAMLWEINPFDQWGVELGKTLACQLVHLIEDKNLNSKLDASTAGLLAFYMAQQKK